MNTTETLKPQVKAGCYCRISSDPDDKREGVDRQREDTTALCEVKGWTPAAFYVDNDRSASSGSQRPEWDRLLADIKAGKIDAVAAWDQDRGWRMMHELESLRRFFTTLGRHVPLATTGQGDIDLCSPTGVLQAQIKTAVSEHEVAMLKVRQRRAARQRAEQGIAKWKYAFGYLTGEHEPDCAPNCKGHHHRADPQTAPLVKEAYAALLAGSSLGEIARMFNDAGALGLNGKPWTPSTVSLFLRAARNAGLRSHNDELVIGEDGQPVKGNWPALIDESTWRTAQSVLNAPGRAPGRKSVRRHPLTGVMRCGKQGCDGHLAGNWAMQATGGPRAHSIVYTCRKCRGCSVRADHVTPLLYKLIGGRLAMPDAEDLLKAEMDTDEAEAIRAELSVLYGELKQIGIERGQRLLTGEQAKIATDLINGDIAKLERRQRDQERLRVFEDIPIGTAGAIDAVKALSPDRFRAVVDVLATITVEPVGKHGHVFNGDRVQVDWR